MLNLQFEYLEGRAEKLVHDISEHYATAFSHRPYLPFFPENYDHEFEWEYSKDFTFKNDIDRKTFVLAEVAKNTGNKELIKDAEFFKEEVEESFSGEMPLKSRTELTEGLYQLADLIAKYV